MQSDTAGTRLLRVRGLSKAFTGVVAVDEVDFDIAGGEIVALLGQNGAGKSTLIQVLAGLHPVGSYSGEILLNDKPLHSRSVAEAEAAGIAFLAQEINVAPDLTVAEGLFLDNEPTRFGLIDRPLRKARARAVLQQFGVDVDLDSPMGDLDLATQQLVLIVRALSKNARLLILDEPTAALTEREASRLFERVRALRASGVAIIFVSHRLAEVFEISDRIVIMRDGRISGTFETSQTTRDTVVDHMVGAALPHREARRTPPSVDVSLEARQLSVFGAAGRPLVDRLDLAVRRGEIVGLFGLLGSGVIEVVMALFGAWRGGLSGTIAIDGKVATVTDPVAAVSLGLGLIAQDRRDGLSAEHSIYDNTILADLPALSPRGFVDRVVARRKTSDLFARLKIKARDIDVEVGALSGGNQQKVQIARWLAAGARVLLLVDPTREVDVGARAEIKRVWTELAEEGRSILLVSSDAEEIVEICDRVVVLRDGREVGILEGNGMTEANLLKLAAGV